MKKDILMFLIIAACVTFILPLGAAIGGQIKASSDEFDNHDVQTTQEKNSSLKIPTKVSLYKVAGDDFSNLKGFDFTKPIYDRYTMEQRLTLGLPLELPESRTYPADKKIAYLTFDDGPDREITPKILDILKEHGIHATFYVVGCKAEAYPDILKRIFDEGHAIGNHSYNHDYNELYPSADNFLWQISRTDEIIHRIIGVRPMIIRAPGGKAGMFTEEYQPMLKSHGYVEHDWNVCTNDATAERPDAARQLYYVDAQTSGALKNNMALVLMHSTGGKDETVKALPSVINLLKQKGYSFGVVTPTTPQP